MSQIWITSDWHFCHSQPFLYEPRGFKNQYEMNAAIIERHNAIVQADDEVYALGDCILNDNLVAYYIQGDRFFSLWALTM